MKEDGLDRSEFFLNEIGVTILQDQGRENHHLWLYCEAGDAWVNEALFKVEDGTLTWLDPIGDAGDVIMDFWDSLPPEERWFSMVFEIQGTSFTTDFYYDDDLPPGEDSLDRREELIRRRFSNHQIVYPPFPGAPTN